MLTLYDYYRSSASFRVRITLNLKALHYHLIPIHLLNHGGEQYSEHYQQINPQSMVPTLDDAGTIITQSLAIIEYIEDLYPSPSILPKRPDHKAYVKSIALMIAADIHPLQNLRVTRYLTEVLHISDHQKNEWYQHWIHKGLKALEWTISQSALSGDFCYGASPTLADICLVPQLFSARRFNCNTSLYPCLERIDANCQKMDAFIKAWPKELTK